MSVESNHLPGDSKPQKWVTPSEDLGVLSYPQLTEYGLLARSNRQSSRLAETNREALRSSWPSPAEKDFSRAEVMQCAINWTRAALESTQTSGLYATVLNSLPSRSKDDLHFVTGHQPALFHPGVWIKNLITSAAARRNDGISLNIIVDNDLTPPPWIQVPTGTGDSAKVITVAYDRPHPPRPFEEAQIIDRDCFDEFGSKVAQAMRECKYTPGIERYWSKVMSAFELYRHPAWAFSAARASTEWEMGAGTLEIPMSRLCELPIFRTFCSLIILDLEQFCLVYHQVLDEYRQRHRVRSRNHPVAALRVEGDWRESPFWIWQPGATHRNRLMIRTTREQIDIADQTLRPLGSVRTDIRDVGRCLEELSAAGWRIRPRALTTTLFARLFLADLFVHGTGGARYDEMTNQLIARWAKLYVPDFAVVSATVRLPIGVDPPDVTAVRKNQSIIRESWQHPERFLRSDVDRLSVSPEIAQKLSEIDRLILEQQQARRGELSSQSEAWYPHHSGRQRMKRLHELRSELAQFTQGPRDQAETSLALAQQRSEVHRSLLSREFAWILQPAERLENFFQHVCQNVR